MSSPPSIPTADKISSLPDSVLSHILSFLPTKFAVATSVLSKRWTPLWLSIPTLDFDEESFPDFTSFRHFVYSVLVSRDVTLPVRSFRIKCGQSDNFDRHDLNRFVLIAVQQGLEKFDLILFSMIYDRKILASTILRLLSCKTLVVLKLKNMAVYNLPHLVDLPLLKTLHLVSIYFLKFEHLINLFNGCPILEDLLLENVQVQPNYYWHDLNVEFKGFPNLVRANLHDYDYVQNFPFSWLYNAKFICVEVQKMSIVEHPIPTFHNLTHMELIFNRKYEWPENWVIQVLQHCPKLQNLIIVQADDYEEEVIEDEYLEEPKAVPECLSSQLRICSLRGFRGNEFELQFAEYIMLNSKLLCTMAIESNWVDEKAKHQMLKKLSSYPRGSVTCKLLFDWFQNSVPNSPA